MGSKARYFTCEPKYGIFVLAERVMLLEQWNNAMAVIEQERRQIARQSPSPRAETGGMAAGRKQSQKVAIPIEKSGFGDYGVAAVNGGSNRVALAAPRMFRSRSSGSVETTNVTTAAQVVTASKTKKASKLESAPLGAEGISLDKRPHPFLAPSSAPKTRAKSAKNATLNRAVSAPHLRSAESLGSPSQRKKVSSVGCRTKLKTSSNTSDDSLLESAEALLQRRRQRSSSVEPEPQRTLPRARTLRKAVSWRAREKHERKAKEAAELENILLRKAIERETTEQDESEILAYVTQQSLEETRKSEIELARKWHAEDSARQQQWQALQAERVVSSTREEAELDMRRFERRASIEAEEAVWTRSTTRIKSATEDLEHMSPTAKSARANSISAVANALAEDEDTSVSLSDPFDEEPETQLVRNLNFAESSASAAAIDAELESIKLKLKITMDNALLAIRDISSPPSPLISAPIAINSAPTVTDSSPPTSAKSMRSMTELLNSSQKKLLSSGSDPMLATTATSHIPSEAMAQETASEAITPKSNDEKILSTTTVSNSLEVATPIQTKFMAEDKILLDSTGSPTTDEPPPPPKSLPPTDDDNCQPRHGSPSVSNLKSCTSSLPRNSRSICDVSESNMKVNAGSTPPPPPKAIDMWYKAHTMNLDSAIEERIKARAKELWEKNKN